MSDRGWTITGYDGARKIFEQVVSVERIAESDVKALLQRLVARHWSEAEVLEASLDFDHRSPLLEVIETTEGPFGFTTNPNYPRFYVATLGEVADEPAPAERGEPVAAYQHS